MISRVELIRKDKEKFRSARKIPPSGKQAFDAYTRSHASLAKIARVNGLLVRFPSVVTVVTLTNKEKRFRTDITDRVSLVYVPPVVILHQ